MRKFYLVYDMLGYRCQSEPEKSPIYKRPMLYVRSMFEDEFYVQISVAKERVSPSVKASHVSQIAYDNGIPQHALYFTSDKFSRKIGKAGFVDSDGKKQLSLLDIPF